MEFDNPDKNPSDRETSFYENTKVATQKCAGQSKQNKMDDDEGHYEHLRLESKVKESKPNLQEDVIKRIKVISSVFLALLIALYIGVVALVIFIAVPKEQDGGWSNWENWSACTESCGGGIKSQNRSCSNPAPSMLGKQCLGNSEQISQCNKQLCPGTDGGWSVWEDWGTCTESCGGWVRTRTRSCTNPTPSMSGRPCTGDYIDVSTCNKTTCPEHSVAFTAYDIYRNSSTNSILLFRRTHINIGDGYDTTTGKFTCPIPGVYHFVVTLTTYYQDINSVRAYLRINGSRMLYLYFNPKDDDSGSYMMTGAGTFHLNQNDVVYVYGTPDDFYDYHPLFSHFSYFTGFLITPDQ